MVSVIALTIRAAAPVFRTGAQAIRRLAPPRRKAA